MKRLIAILLLSGCSEYTVRDGPKVPPAEPPGSEADDFGDPPDWADCYEGFRAQYTNLQNDHPAVEPELDEEDDGDPGDPMALDWWDDPDFERFDASLSFGENWWPLDDGLADDPAYFVVRWIAWIRVRDADTLELTLGSDDDSWVFIEDEAVAALPGLHDYDPQVFEWDAPAGQFPIEIRYAHRAGDSSGFRFRVSGGDTTICYPDYGADE